MRAILVKRLTMRGFIFSDGFDHRRDEFLQTMSSWLREGKIKYREDMVRGLENAPGAFLGLLAGRNFGKLVVKVGADDEAAAPRDSPLKTALLRVAQMEEADRLTSVEGTPAVDAHAQRRQCRGGGNHAALVAASRRGPLRSRQ